MALYRAELCRPNGNWSMQKCVVFIESDATAAYVIAKRMCGGGYEPTVNKYIPAQPDITITKDEAIKNYGQLEYNKAVDHGTFIERECIYRENDGRWFG